MTFIMSWSSSCHTNDIGTVAEMPSESVTCSSSRYRQPYLHERLQAATYLEKKVTLEES